MCDACLSINWAAEELQQFKFAVAITVGINILHAYVISQNEQLIWQGVNCSTVVYQVT